MPRSVNAVASRARRKKILKEAKGFYGKRKNVYTVAKNVLEKGQGYKFSGRKQKKRLPFFVDRADQRRRSRRRHELFSIHWQVWLLKA